MSSAPRDRLTELIRTVAPDVREIQAVPHEGGHWRIVALDATRSIPLIYFGDGTKRLIALSAALASEKPIVLLEEPERCLHWSATRTLAKVIAQSVRPGFQVILTTHSFRFVEYLEKLIPSNELSILKLSLSADGELTAQGCTAGAALSMDLDDLS